MESNISSSILRVCKIFNEQAVEYLIVGGTAVALHGYYRHSTDLTGAVVTKPDLDFWYNPTYGNYFKLLDALEKLGQDVSECKNDQAPNPKKSFFRYGFELFTLDILPELKASLTFNRAFVKRETVTLNQIAIPFLCYDDLLMDKAVNARPKDLIDIAYLKSKRQSEE